MKGYAHIYNKNEQDNLDTFYTNDKVTNIMQKYFNLNTKVESYRLGQIITFMFTNEPKFDLFEINRQKQFIISYAGYIVKSDTDLYREMVSSRDVPDTYIHSLSGVFSLSAVDFNTNKITVWNNVSGVEPVFWVETERNIVVGNKAVLVHLLAYQVDQPIYDVKNLISFINNGYFVGYNTPFKDTYVLPINSKLVIKDNGRKLTDIARLSESLYTIEPDKKVLDDITETFLQSFSGMKKNFTGDISAALTGGKDSRLIVSGLENLGIDFTVYTNGDKDNADVIVAQKVSNALKIPHEIYPPSEPNAKNMEVNIMERVQNAIKSSEGLLYAYENIFIPKPFDPTLISMGGQGGELLRGGFAANNNIKTMDELIHLIKSRFAQYNDFFYSSIDKKYSDELVDYVYSQPKHMTPMDILSKIFTDFRTARWSGAALPVYSMESLFYTPFFDSKLVRKAQMIKNEYTSKERLIYEILHRLSPELVDIPFAKDRWYFEKEKPTNKKALIKWKVRNPIYANNPVGDFNWRQNVLVHLKEEFYEGIFHDENSDIFNFVNKKKVKELFEANMKNPNSYNKFLWGLYTASVMITNKWINNEMKTEDSIIEIPRRSDDYIRLEERIISPRLLHTRTRRIKLKKGKAFADIKVISNKKLKKLYFQLFKGSFDKVPSYRYLNVSRVKQFNKFEILIDISKPKNTADVKLTMFVMQYDKKRKIFTTKEQFIINQPSKLINLFIDKADNARKFNLAFKIEKDNSPVEFCINELKLNGYK